MNETLKYQPATMPDRHTYYRHIIQVLKVNTTRSCWMQCRFCDFSTFVPLTRAHKLPPLTLVDTVQTDPRVTNPCDLIKIRGGLSFFEPWSYIRTAIRLIHQKNPAPIQALSAVEIMHFHRVEKTPVEELLEELRWAGASALGPGGSELLVEDWRQTMSPWRITAQDWLRIHQLALGAGLKPQASLMVFSGITKQQILDHIALLKGVASLSHLEIKPFRPTKTPLAILERPHILELLAVIQLIHRELPNVIIEIHVDHLSQDTQDLLVMHGVSRLLITREELEG